MYYYWIDATIFFSVSDIPHINDKQITNKLTNYGIIHQIKINESKYINPAFRIDIFVNNTIHESNQNIDNRKYNNLLNKKWFFHPLTKISWIQAIEYDNNIQIAMKILTT